MTYLPYFTKLAQLQRSIASSMTHFGQKKYIAPFISDGAPLFSIETIDTENKLGTR